MDCQIELTTGLVFDGEVEFTEFMIQVHHLNCSLPETKGIDFKSLGRDLCCHCLLLETKSGLALVDTGVSESFIQGSFRKHIFNSKVSRSFRTVTSEIVRKGFDPKDVQHIFITHLDHDHVGGLSDFPWAKVYIHSDEATFVNSQSLSSKNKLRFDSKLWSESHLTFLGEAGEKWFNFDSVKSPKGFEDEILTIPLFGHTAGHCGFAIKLEKNWLLHAGDSFYLKDDLASKLKDRNIFSEALAGLLAVDQKSRIHNLERLRYLNQSHPECHIINSHDASFLRSI